MDTHHNGVNRAGISGGNANLRLRNQGSDEDDPIVIATASELNCCGVSNVTIIMILAFLVTFLFQVQSYLSAELQQESTFQIQTEDNSSFTTQAINETKVEPAKIIKEDTLKCENKLVLHINGDPCYQPSNHKRIFECACGSKSELSNKITYLIPKPRKDTQPLTQQQLREDVIFTFIHVNKAGGTTIKSDVLFEANRIHKWNGAGFGTYRGWKILGLPWKSDNNDKDDSVENDKALNGESDSASASNHESENDAAANQTDTDDEYSRRSRRELKSLSKMKSEDFRNLSRLLAAHDESISPLFYKKVAELYRCGEKDPSGRPMKGDEKCKFRTVWGALSMGLCQHFPHRPCVYIIVLRDPVERAISSYNYVCVQGKENRKGWLPEWKKANKCPLTIDEFIHMNITSQYLLTERLTRGCDVSCGGKAALENLMHPCMRYLLLDKLWDGMQKLSATLGPALRGIFDKLIAHAGHENESDYPARTIQQLKNKKMMENVRRMLAHDIALYKAAVDNYEQQWKNPLVSCNG